MLVQPLDHATGRGPRLRLRTRESVVGLGDRAAFVEIGAPVLSGPSALAWPYQSENRELVTRECIKHRLRCLAFASSTRFSPSGITVTPAACAARRASAGLIAFP